MPSLVGHSNRGGSGEVTPRFYPAPCVTQAPLRLPGGRQQTLYMGPDRDSRH
jgi:hypothetical protein